MSALSVAFVDDHPVFLMGISGLFSGNSGYRVVGTGTTTAEAASLVRSHSPDVLVIDLNLPGDPYRAIAEISQTRTKIVVFTASTGIDCAVRALDAGASGYLLKGSSANELMTAIDSVVRGETFINQTFAAQIIAAMRSKALRRIASPETRLSVRERQIVQHLMHGRTNREIAETLHISEKTVKHYMTVLMQKLHVRNRVEAVIAAQKLQETAVHLQ